jgi:hypothetical protein
MSDKDEQLVLSVNDLREMLKEAEYQAEAPSFGLIPHFNSENIVEIAKSQFPRLEAKVAIQKELEKTRRMLIAVAGFCLIAGAALIVFAPQGKEGVSYVVAVSLAILSLGAIGIQELRIRTIGISIDGGENAVKNNANK